MRDLIPDREKTDESQRTDSRDPHNHAKRADWPRHNRTNYQPPIRNQCGDSTEHKIHRHEKAELVAHDVKYSCKDHDQRQADGSERRKFRFGAGHRRHNETDASKKLTYSDENEQALRDRMKPYHGLMECMF